jgi:hypothetical protein
VKEDETDVNTFRKYRVHCENGRKQSSACYLLHAGFSLGSFFHPEEGDMFLRNVCWLSA